MSEQAQEKEKVEKKPLPPVVIRFYAVIVLLFGLGVGWFVYNSEITQSAPFKYGLDLAGGSHLVYDADTSGVIPEEVAGAMQSLREVIERRVNAFGVSEPIVQVERSSVFAEGEPQERLIVELPGVTDVSEAIALIGKTPLLEFKLVDTQVLASASSTEEIDEEALYIDTGLTGALLQRATLQFGNGGHAGGGLSNEPIILVDFNSEGSSLFADITTANVGNLLAIFLDGEVISQPVIREPILGGTATISGGFDPEEARILVRDLNFGALPVPIELQSTQSIGASLGAEVLEKGVRAGVIGLILVAVFMILWYRLPGLVAVVSLGIYIVMMLAIFKFVPVVITAAGLAGFVLSIGMAVDANVLIFERMKEELRKGKGTQDAAREGFARAWLAIRDGNFSSILTAIVLFWFGTSLVKGFALTFGVGVLVSMISAITFTRTLLLALPNYGVTQKKMRALFSSGFSLK